MNKNINISLDDVKDFLQTQGYTWKNVIIFNNDKTSAVEFNQLNGQRGDLTILKLHTSKEVVFKPTVINETTFTFYNEILGSDIDDTFDYELEQDLSELWVKFLAQRYGELYHDYVKNLCRSMRKKEIETDRDRLAKISLIKRDIIKNLRAKLTRFENIEEWLKEVTELKK